MYEIDGSGLIRYKAENFILLTTTKQFFLPVETELQNFNLPTSLQDKLLSREKLQCLLKFLSKSCLSFDKVLLLPEQVHGNNIIVANEPEILEKASLVIIDKHYSNEEIIVKYKIFPQTDGVISMFQQTAIIVFTADCVPLFVYDTAGGSFGLVHVGRKGIENKIIENLIFVLKKNIKDTSHLRFIIGPHICPDCYLVDGEPYPLAEKILQVLQQHGFSTSSINVVPFCTYHTPDTFFSYRKDKTPYRLISFITPK